MVARALVVLGTLLVAAPRARADDAPAALAWTAEVGCGSVEVLRARVAIHLGRPLRAADGVAAAVEVVRAPLDRDVRAHLRITSGGGVAERDVRGADCTAVVEAVAFVIASAVSDVAAPPPPPPPPPPGPPGLTLGRGAPVTATPRPAVVRAHLRLDGWSDAGTLPEFRLGLGGTLALSYARARVEVGRAWWRRGWTGTDAEGSATALTESDVRGCGGVWELWVCGGAMVGTLEVAGRTSQRWSALSTLVRWTRPVGRHLALTASIEGLAALDRPAFGDPTSRHTAGAAVRLGLGIEVIAP